VTHPFHPLSGREFELVTYKKAWGEDRVYFRDRKGRLHHMPVGWTSVEVPDPFRTLAAGRCRFRTEDLLRLADIVAGLLTPGRLRERKGNNAATVRTNTPRKPSRERASGKLIGRNHKCRRWTGTGTA
jgi:hypothetical protein